MTVERMPCTFASSTGSSALHPRDKLAQSWSFSLSSIQSWIGPGCRSVRRVGRNTCTHRDNPSARQTNNWVRSLDRVPNFTTSSTRQSSSTASAMCSLLWKVITRMADSLLSVLAPCPLPLALLLNWPRLEQRKLACLSRYGWIVDRSCSCGHLQPGSANVEFFWACAVLERSV